MSDIDRDQVFLSYPDPLWLLDLETGRILDVNQAALSLLGYQREAFLELDAETLCPVAFNPEISDFYQALRRHKRNRLEMVLCSATGQLLRWPVLACLLEHSRVPRAMIILEISAQQEQNRVLKQLTEHMPGVIYVLEEKPDGEILMPYVSRAVRDIFGLESEQLFQNPRALYELIHAADLDKVKEAHDLALQEKHGWKLEYRIHHALTGEVRWIFGEAVPQFRANGSVTWYGYVADTSEINRMRESLRLSDERLRLATEIAGIGVWELDSQSLEMIWNQRMFEIYGLPVTTHVSLEDWKNYLHPDDQTQIDKLTPETLGSEPYSLRHRIIRPNGEVRHIEMYGRILYDSSQQAIKAVGINFDRTPVVLAEEELKRSQFELEGTNLLFRERVKELTLLHGISRLLQTKSSFNAQILDEIVRLIPPGWLYPEICAAHICWGTYAAMTSNWQNTAWKLSADFESAGIPGKVEVVYLLRTPEIDEGPFMQEERHLIDSIAEMLQVYIEQQMALKAIHEHQLQLQSQNQKLLDITWKQSHGVRRPLANILGLIQLLQTAESSPEMLEHLKNEAHSLDGIIREVVAASEQALIESAYRRHRKTPSFRWEI